MKPAEIKALRKRLGLSQTEFGKRIAASLRSVQNYEKGNTQPSAEILLKLLELNAQDSASKKLPYQEETADAIKVNDPLEIFNTKAGSNYEELSNGKYLLTVPLVPVRAQATYVSEFADADFMSGLTKVSFVVDRVGKGKYQAFEIQNDSMDDGTSNYIPDGAIVLGRELGRQHWKTKFRTKEYPYWIIVHKHTVLCKEIILHDVENGIITCHSLNESPEYSDFDLHLDDVKQLFNIIKKQI